VRWASGAVQAFEALPLNHTISIEEGSEKFDAKPFSARTAGSTQRRRPQAATGAAPDETWLLQPLTAPDFSLTTLSGDAVSLSSASSAWTLLTFWKTGSRVCEAQLRTLSADQAALRANGMRVLTINVDGPSEGSSVQAFVAAKGISVPVLLATDEVAGVYDILYRYLFDRRRNLPLPVSFLIDADKMIVKVYAGAVSPKRLVDDTHSAPRTPAERTAKALPFPGTLYASEFRRNDFTYGVAFFQHGYFDQAAVSFKQVIEANPNDAEAHYNLGTLYLRRNDDASARLYLQQALKLRPMYPEAWNNLAMVAAHEGNSEEAIRDFRQALTLRPGYVTALLNLGNFYRHQNEFDEAKVLLLRAVDSEPDNAEANYSLGMLYGQQGDAQRASEYLQTAITLRPDYADALNNLAVLFVNAKRFSEAEEKFKACIDVAPRFDQAYLNLARLYVLLNEKEKARAVLAALLKQQPNHSLAQQAMEMLR
jgi:Flp pilus assembly protein TadD/peroxiredoxin